MDWHLDTLTGSRTHWLAVYFDWLCILTGFWTHWVALGFTDYLWTQWLALEHISCLWVTFTVFWARWQAVKKISFTFKIIQDHVIYVIYRRWLAPPSFTQVSDLHHQNTRLWWSFIKTLSSEPRIQESCSTRPTNCLQIIRLIPLPVLAR